MKTGDRVNTPRFCTVTIKAVFENRKAAAAAGYTEPTHYHENGYSIAGRSLDMYHMEFAAYKE